MPLLRTSSRGWVIYGLYHDMTDTGEPAFTGVVDNVNAFTPATAFRGLQADVLSVREYEDKVRAQTNGRQAAQMGQLVTSYQY